MIEVLGNAEYADGTLTLSAGAQPIADGVEIGAAAASGTPIARAEVTLTTISDVASTTRYYTLVSASAAAPSVPTSNPPIGWSATEPTHVAGANTALYVVDLTEYTDGTWAYSPVSKSTSYDAAIDAGRTATDYIEWKDGEGLRVGHKESDKWKGTSTLMASDGFKVLDTSGAELSSFGAEDVSLCGGDVIVKSGVTGDAPWATIRTRLGVGFGMMVADGMYAFPTLMFNDGTVAFFNPSREFMTVSDNRFYGKMLAGECIYESKTGADSGTVALSRRIGSGISALDIVFTDETREYSQRVYNDDRKSSIKSSISRTVSNAASGAVFIASATISIDDDTMTITNNAQAQISAGGIEVQGAVLKIVKVIGWR